MSIAEILKWAVSKIKSKNIDSAIFDAEILLSFILKKSREYLYTYPEKELSKKQISKFRFLISQRAKGKPVPYLTHHQEFFGLDFYVDENVLIPRPETEILMEEVLKHITQVPRHPSNQLTIIDIGTGSGCLAIALAKNLPDVKIIATDISKNALKIVKKNATKHKVLKQIKFIQGNLLQPFLKMSLQETPLKRKSNPILLYDNSGLPRPDEYIGSRNDNQKQCHCEESATADDEAIPNSNCKIIIANLPYLTKKQLKNVSFEPKTALDGGKDGLEVIKKFLFQIRTFINHQDVIFLEISPEQVKPLKSIIKKYLLNKEVSLIKDLSGKERIVKIN